MTTFASLSLHAVDRRGPRWPTVAGITYVGAWLLGLAAFGAGPASEA